MVCQIMEWLDGRVHLSFVLLGWVKKCSDTHPPYMCPTMLVSYFDDPCPPQHHAQLKADAAMYYTKHGAHPTPQGGMQLKCKR